MMMMVIDNRFSVSMWLGSSVLRALDLQLNGREFDPRPLYLGRLVLGWVTVFEWAYHLGVELATQAKLSLLASVGWEMTIGQSAFSHCG